MNYDLDKYITELENLLEESWTVPLIKNKYCVDSEKLASIIEKIRKCYPIEISQAKEIINKKEAIEKRAMEDSEEMRRKAARFSEEIMIKARANKEKIIAEAEEIARSKIDNQEIMQNANRQAAAIIQKAKDDSRKMRMVTRDYILSSLTKTSNELEKANDIINKLKETYNDEDNK